MMHSCYSLPFRCNLAVSVFVEYELGVRNRPMDLKDVAKVGVFEPIPTKDDSIVRAAIRHSLINLCFMGL